MIDINIVFDMSSKTVGFAAGTCSDVGANGYHPATATSASTPASTTTSNFAAVTKTSGERLVLKRTNSGAMLDVLEAETGGGVAGAGTGAKGACGECLPQRLDSLLLLLTTSMPVSISIKMLNVSS